MKVNFDELRRWTGLILLGLTLTVSVGAFAGEYPVADWTLQTTGGETISLHDALDDGPVLLTFWALWCGPCLKELPHIEELAAEMRGDLTILAVNIDGPRGVSRVRPYLESHGFTLDVPLDTAGDVSRTMQVGGTIPFLLLLDSEGHEIYRHTGYKAGDEIELRRQIQNMMDAGHHEIEHVTATDEFDYSYNTDTEKESFENWLDVEYLFGSFRTGLLLNTRQPARESDVPAGDENFRRTDIVHRYFAYAGDDVEVRIGHFFGTFGRGLLFASYEDRRLRVDTSLDGILVQGSRGRLRATAFSGSPSARDIDVRGLDTELKVSNKLLIGASTLTWRPDYAAEAEAVRREWAAAGRLDASFRHGGIYLEYATKEGLNFDDPGYRHGNAFYGALNVFGGPFGLSVEHKDYSEFTILPGADGRVSLNNPPSLTRDHLYSLLNRAPHAANLNDEVGTQAEATYSGLAGWAVLANASRLEKHDGERLYEEIYAHVENEDIGDFRVSGGLGYRDSEGLRQVGVGEVTWFIDETNSLTLEFEHQHVRMEELPALDPGAYDEDLIKLEYNMAPAWSFTGLMEMNNKYEAQMTAGEKSGPFPALEIAWATDKGATFTLWAGKRQAGYVCSGGVCRYEPSFEGMEIAGRIRY